MSSKLRKNGSPRTSGPTGTGYVADVRHKFGLSVAKFARATSLSERTIRQYEKASEPLSETQLRTIRELDRLHAALCQVVDPSEIGPWMERPNPAFEDFKPLELLERGQADRLWRMVYYLESGSPS
jgi:hypothetical protein